MARTKHVQKAASSLPSDIRREMNRTTRKESLVSSNSDEHVDENKILKQLNKTGQDHDSDIWPIFVLNDALVYCGHDGDLRSVINAELEGPLTVRGKLNLSIAERDNAGAVRKDARKNYPQTITIVVPGVTQFSIDDSQTIWAAGDAGWYEIRPSKEYNKIHKTMTEGVRLFYAIYDIHCRATLGPRKKLPDFETVAAKFEDTPQGKNCKTTADFKALVLRHAKFLFSHMKPGTSDFFEWYDTPFYVWLKRNAFDIYQLYFPGAIYPPSDDDMAGNRKNKSKGKGKGKQAAPVARTRTPEPPRPYAGKGSTRRPVMTPAASRKQQKEADEEASDLEFTSPKRRKVLLGPGDDDDDGIGAANKISKPIKNERIDALVAGSTSAANGDKEGPQNRVPRGHGDSDPESDGADEGGSKKDCDDDEGDDAASDASCSCYEFDVESMSLGQSMEPNGPNGSWQCERSGCNGFIVDDFGDQDDLEEQVRVHFMWHAEMLEERIATVREYERPYASTDNIVGYMERLGNAMRNAARNQQIWTAMEKEATDNDAAAAAAEGEDGKEEEDENKERLKAPLPGLKRAAMFRHTP